MWVSLEGESVGCGCIIEGVVLVCIVLCLVLKIYYRLIFLYI